MMSSIQGVAVDTCQLTESASATTTHGMTSTKRSTNHEINQTSLRHQSLNLPSERVLRFGKFIFSTECFRGKFLIPLNKAIS